MKLETIGKYLQYIVMAILIQDPINPLIVGDDYSIIRINIMGIRVKGTFGYTDLNIPMDNKLGRMETEAVVTWDDIARYEGMERFKNFKKR